MKPKSTLRSYLAIASSTLLAISYSHAGNTWDGGGGDDNWSTGANWNPDGAPGFGTLTFSGSTRTTNIVDYSLSMNMLLWTGSSAWTLNNSGGSVISLYDYSGAAAKIENQSTGLVTINAPITFAATAGQAWGEINAVGGDITFDSSGVLTVNGSQVAGIKMFSSGRTINFNNTVSASGKWFATTGATGMTANVGGAFTSGDIYLMNDSILKLYSGGSITTSAVRLGGDFGTTLTQDLTKGATFQLTSLTGGQSFSSTINTVANNTSGTLLVDSLATSGTNTITSIIALDSDLRIQQAAGGNLSFTTGAFDIKARKLTFDGAGTITVNQALTSTIAAGGYIVKQGAGTLVLTNTSNNYTGTSNLSLNANGTQINAGTLAIAGDGSLGLAPNSAYNNIQFTGSGTLRSDAIISLNANRSISIASGAIATFNTNGNDLTTAGLISGLGGLTKSGSGILTLSNTSNSYSGQLTVANGTLAIGTINNASANGNLGNNALPVILGSAGGNTGTLRWTPAATGSTTKPFSIASGGGGAIDVVSSGWTLTLSGAFNPSGNFTALGAGALTISGTTTLGAAQTWTNNASSSVFFTVGNAATAPINIGAHTLTFDGTGITRVFGDLTGAGNLIKNGTGKVAIGGQSFPVTINHAYSGTTTINAGILQMQNNDIGAGNIEINGAVDSAVLSQYYGNTFTRDIGSSSGQMRITGGVSGFSTQGNPGVWTFTGTGSNPLVWGSTNFAPTEFILQASDANTSATGTFTNNINLNGADRTIRSDQTGGTAGNGTFSGVISNSTGTAGLIKVGIGHHILSNTNTYNGSTTISAGTLTANSTAALGNSSATNTLIFNGGTLRAGGAITSVAARGVTLTTDGTIDTNGFAVSIAGNVTGAGGLIKNGTGTLTLSGTNNYGGVTTVNAGTLAITKEASLASNTAANVNLKAGVGLTLNVDTAGSAGFTISNLDTLLGNISVASTAVTGWQGGMLSLDTSTSAATFTQGNAITDTTGAFGGVIGLTKLGTGTLVLDNANTYSGATIISAGTLELAAGGSIASKEFWNNATFKTNSAGDITQGTPFTLIRGSGALVKEGAGTLTLNLANTFTSTTTVSAGTIAITNALALQNSAYNTTGSNGTSIGLDVTDGLSSGKLTLGGLAGSVDLAGAFTAGFTGSATNLTLNPQAGVSNSYAGIIANGSMTLTKTGAGTQTLTNTNTYTGATSIKGAISFPGSSPIYTGALTLSGTAGSINGSSGVTVENGATLNLDNTSGSLERILDTSTLTLNGGTVVLTGNTTTNVTETIDTLAIGAGASTITLTGTAAGRLHTIAATDSTAAFTRTGNGTALIRGTNLQTAATNATRLSISGTDGGTGLTLIGSTLENKVTVTTGTTKTLKIVPYLIGDTSATGGGSSFLTYDLSGALRPLASGEYTTLTAGYVATDHNVTSLNGSITAGSPTVNSLLFNGTHALNGTGTLTVNSGAIALTTNNAASIGAGFSGLVLGSGAWNEGIVTVAQSTLTINTPITVNGNGVFTKAGGGVLVVNGSIGASTATSLVLNAGVLKLIGTQSFTGTITLNGGSFGENSANSNPIIQASTLNSRPITVNGTAASALVVEGTTTSTITINPDAVLRIGASGSALTVSGVVSGSGTLDVNANNYNSTYSVSLTNTANTFSGDVIYAASNGSNTFSVASIGDSGKVMVGQFANGAVKTFALNSLANAGLTFSTRQFGLVGPSGGHNLAIANSSAQAFTINTNLLSSGVGTRTLTLQGAGTGLSTFAGTIGNGNLTSLALTKSEAGTWWLTGANLYTGTTTVSAGTLGFANNSLGYYGSINASGGTLLWLPGNTQDISSRLAMTTAAGTTTLNTNGNNVTFASAIGSSNTGNIVKNGLGTLTLGGTNTYTGSTTLNAGSLKLDYAASNGSKLSDTATTGTLLLNGGTLELSGGSHTETVLSTTLNTGGTFITQTNSGTSTLSMGAITFTGGAIDFSADSIATTTSTVTNGILSQRATVAGTNFAMKSGSNIVAYDYVTSGSTGYTGGAMSANINYRLTANGASTLSGTTGATSNTLKIANTATGSLAVAANTLTVGAILFTGSADYSITTSGAGRVTPTILHNYGTGGAVLNLGALGGALTQFGTGTTVLASTAQNAAGVNVNGGTVRFSNNDQIGTPSSGAGITLNNGTLLASASVALNNGGVNHRAVTLGAGGGTLAATTGNTLTVSGVISGAGNPLAIGSATNTGTVSLTTANTYSGNTTINGGTLALGASGSIAASPVIKVGTGSTLDVSAVSGGWTLGSSQTLTGTGGVTGNATIAGTHSVGNSPGKQAFSGNLTYSTGSIFQWDLGSATTTGRGTNYDAVNVGGTLGGSGALLRVVIAEGMSFAETFWQTNRTWTDIFTNTAEDTNLSFASIFSGIHAWDGNANVTETIGSYGSFSISGSNLNWTTSYVPEPTSALAGLLLTAGLLRRRRK